jgi:hypothetical protein
MIYLNLVMHYIWLFSFRRSFPIYYKNFFCSNEKATIIIIQLSVYTDGCIIAFNIEDKDINDFFSAITKQPSINLEWFENSEKMME